MTQDKIEITKEQFAAFRKVQQSEKTNMLDASAVLNAMKYVLGDTWATTTEAHVYEIMHSYESLLEKFEGVKS